MQRPEAENRLERPLMPTETERRNDTGEYPRRNGLIGVSVEFCGLGRLDGGGSSLRRTSLSLQIWEMQGNFAKMLGARRLIPAEDPLISTG